MENPVVLTVVLSLSILIVAALAYYAGRLLFLLRQQTKKQNQIRSKRIDNIVQSIQTIAAATEQQQCDLSEASIRICRLLAALPIKNIPDFSIPYPSLHELYKRVEEMPTHEIRAALTRADRQHQDKVRQQHESELETDILKEVTRLKRFTI